MRWSIDEIMVSIGIQHVRARIKIWRVFVDFMLIQETRKIGLTLGMRKWPITHAQNARTRKSI